ncbi:hypothetical protein [Pseudosulfitobacter sp. SM2401]|uniref:hypothetical protein n=1 Tax=Pseudosulfitobacter sp. SM2401 TaxID=3350098 RepID=UPI0036F42C9C
MSNFDTSMLTLLKPDNVLGFLGANGWEQYSSQPYFSVWTKGDYEVLIPKEGTRDFPSRMFEALEEISSEKDLNTETVFRQMLMSGFETLKVSTVGPSSMNGTVSLSDGVKLIGNVRDLLISSASAVIEPRRSYAGKRAGLAETFLQTARLGQTEHGSFILTVLAPVMKEETNVLPGFEPPQPYGARVVETLLNATDEAANAAKLSFEESNWFDERFVPLVTKGVNANLCSAVSNLLKIEGTERVIFSINPSSNFRPERTKVDIPATLSERFEKAAIEFRKDPPLDNVNVHGKTISFRREAVTKSGVVSIKANVGGENKRISFGLSPDDYNLVLEAHKYGHPISFTADLRKNARSYEALNIRNLKSLAGSNLFSPQS